MTKKRNKNKIKLIWRKKSVQKYIAGRGHDVSRFEIQAFVTGFNMAWKISNKIQCKKELQGE